MKNFDFYDPLPPGRRRKAIIFAKTLLLCVALGLAGTTPLDAQQTRWDVTYSGRSILSVLEDLRTRTGYSFLHMDGVISENDTVSMTVKEATLENILDRVLVSNGYSYTIRNRDVAITRSATTTVRQQAPRTVTGVVRDSGGSPIRGASVEVGGTRRGTTTGHDGRFAITARVGEVIVFSFVGMESVEITLRGQTTLDVTLKESVAEIDRVVVTGLFDRPGDSFTGAAKTITGADLSRVGSGNISQSLRNIDPSLNITENIQFGSDPNRMPDMELRGTSSFPLSEGDADLRRMYQSNPNQPLFILNGFETSITRIFDLDMQRVLSVTILKDAAAKAIYGAKAANGVVVIETRRSSGELTVTYRGSADIEVPDLRSYDLANSLEKLEVERLSGVYHSDQLSLAKENERLYNERLNAALGGVNTDWLSKPLRTGVGTRHAMSLDVTREQLSVLADVAYSNVAGVMKGSKRNTIQGSLDLAYRDAGKFLIRNVLNVSHNESADSPYGTFREYADMNPYYSPYDADGKLVRAFSGQANPMWNAQLGTSLGADYFNFSNNTYAEYYPLAGMIVRLRFGFETQRDETDRFHPAGHTMFSGAQWTTEENILRRGSYTNGVGRRNSLGGDLSVQYNRQLGKHLIMANAAYTMSHAKSHWLDYVAEGFPSDKMNDMMFARQYARDSRPTGWESIVRDMGVVAVAGYGFDNRYLADVTVRGSASSLYSPKKRWGTFWSVGVAWNVHNEAWASEWRWLERLKLRASTGTTGNQSIEGNAHMVTYEYDTDRYYNSSRPHLNGSSTAIGASIMRLANEDLRWQQKHDINAGFDATIARRLSLVFDYYVSTTTDFVIDFTLPPSMGYFSVKENVGKVENRGVDLSLSYRLVNRPDLYINVTAAFSTNTNRIKELSDAMRHFNASQDKLVDDLTKDGARWKPVLRYVEGGSMTAIWAVPSLGINPLNGREVYVRPDGSLTYEWSSQYQRIVGDEREKFRGNFGLNGEWRGFGLSVLCRFMGGGEHYNATLVQKVENVNVLYNVDRRVFFGRWSESNRYAPYKRLEPYTDSNGEYVAIPQTQPTSRFVQRRNELDIASVSAYYDIGRLRGVKNFGFNRLRLGFNMNELHRFSTIRAERGTDYPFARTMSFSLTAEF